MAQAISLISGSPLIGCPIVYRVVPAAYAANRTFHRIMVRVYAGLDGDEDYTAFDFSTPVETKIINGVLATVASVFDISSALQAVADKYEYEATPPTRYPYIKFRIEAWDEWMVDGTMYSRQGVQYWPSAPETIASVYCDFFGYAFMGAFTDLERMGAAEDEGGAEYLNLSYLSRKPNSSPEVIFKASDNSIKFVYPASFNRGLETDYATGEGDLRRFVSMAPTNNEGPKSVVYTPQAVGAVEVGGHSLYVINTPADAYVLRFINGMGVMESLHVTSFVKRDVNITTEKNTVAKQETLKKFSRSVVRKNNDRETWALTSGALDEEWASWYIHEFLMTEQVWIQLGALWIPCHVIPEETTVLEDRQKAQPYEVQFRLEMDINGAPL
jgi:hypothetical protein